MTDPSDRASRMAAAAVALFAWYGLVLQLYVTVATARSQGTSIASAIVNYISFFTILTNLLVAVVLTAARARINSTLAAFCKRPTVQTAVMVFIAIVGIVYSLVLRNLWDPEGLQKIADVLLHDAVPLFYLVYWLRFVPKGNLHFRNVSSWLIYPGVYLVYTMLRGAISGRYPYPFLDVTGLGYARVGMNVLALLAAFLGMGLLFVAFGRWMSRSRA